MRQRNGHRALPICNAAKNPGRGDFKKCQGPLATGQIRSDVDQARSQSRKTGKIASSDVARSRINWISACQHRAA